MTRQPRSDASTQVGQLPASDHACAVLRRDILLGVHAPGVALRLVDLRTRYDIGASPLHEAMLRLAAEKLVGLENNRGFHVPPLDHADRADIVTMRRRMEPAAARLGGSGHGALGRRPAAGPSQAHRSWPRGRDHDTAGPV